MGVVLFPSGHYFAEVNYFGEGGSRYKSPGEFYWHTAKNKQQKSIIKPSINRNIIWEFFYFSLLIVVWGNIKFFGSIPIRTGIDRFGDDHSTIELWTLAGYFSRNCLTAPQIFL